MSSDAILTFLRHGEVELSVSYDRQLAAFCHFGLDAMRDQLELHRYDFPQCVEKIIQSVERIADSLEMDPLWEYEREPYDRSNLFEQLCRVANKLDDVAKNRP